MKNYMWILAIAITNVQHAISFDLLENSSIEDDELVFAHVVSEKKTITNKNVHLILFNFLDISTWRAKY